MGTTARAAVAAALLSMVMAFHAPATSAQTATIQAPSTDWMTLTELNKVDFTGLTAAQKDQALQILRTEGCPCGCGMKIAECRVKDQNCPTSPGLAAKVVSLVKEGKTADEVKAEMAKASPPKPAAPAAQAQPAAVDAKVDIPLTGAPTKGPANAKVTLVEFSDFECPFCSRALPWVDEIMAAYPNDVRLVFKQFPLSFHKNAKPAAIAALAAGKQGKFWEMHDKLFANSRALTAENFDKWGTEIGLDMKKFKADMTLPELAKQADQDMADGSKAGVRGTPTFFINGHKYNGGRTLDAVKPLIDLAIAGKPMPTAAAAPAPAPEAAVGEAVEIPTDASPSKGPKNAKVTLVEFSDFECPYCSKALPWVDEIMAAYKDDVRLVFKQFPLSFHKNAKPAAIASLAAHKQGKFWEMHDKLFANGRALTQANFELWAKELGMDVEKFKAAMLLPELDKAVDQDMADGTKAGVRGTPSFYVNGKKYNGNRTLDAIKPIIDAEIKANATKKAAK